MMRQTAARTEQAPAKINLTLHITGRRADGLHDLESLVVFADIGDRLTLTPAETPALILSGPTAQVAGPAADNLVLKAVAALAAEFGGLKSGAFDLEKHLPVAAGIGGGSADAAAALRLLCALNDLPLQDVRVQRAARSIGADVPVCLSCEARIMKGTGERLGPPLRLPRLNAVLVNPGLPMATAAVFAELGLKPGETNPGASHVTIESPPDIATLLALIAEGRNDLQPAATRVQPIIGDVIDQISRQKDCVIARMSGSGATCFGIFETLDATFEAVRTLRRLRSNWWVQPVTLG
ncbi:MAG: 4-(cytidine 5'-diphospho)-2-C-methyl-D-erythritol kinase [Proteobacteria bacterium]|nr:4-(cytidine 5'-diphospho)-2-C-methyl-D-erythritol kinase [Pseudomonadota bacterium]